MQVAEVTLIGYTVHIFLTVHFDLYKLFVDGSAGEMVSPSKTATQVNAESLEGKDLYKVSHNDFDVGEFKKCTFL